MNNEPVAWQHKVAESWVTTTKDGDDNEWIPLYTHPAKTLTDEEIYALWEEFNGEIKNFARAILRKAQKK